MLDRIFGGAGEPEPDIIVEQNETGMWEASGPGARSTDVMPTRAELLEVVSHGRRDPGTVVEVRDGPGSYRTTIGKLRLDYGREYRDPRRVEMDPDDEDPFYDFV